MWQCRYGLARETNCQAPPLSPPRQFANRHQQRFNRPSHPFNRNMNGRNTQLPVTVLKELVCTCMTDMWNGAEELPRGPSNGWPLVPIPLLWPMASKGIWSIGYDNYIYITNNSQLYKWFISSRKTTFILCSITMIIFLVHIQ